MSRRLAWSGIGLAAIAPLALGAAASAVSPDGDRLVDLAWATLNFELLLGSLAIAGALLASDGVVRRLGLFPGRLSNPQILALVMGTLGLSAALDATLDLFALKQQSALGELEALVAGVRGTDLLIASVCFAIAPGICEELLCRGLLQRGLVRRFGAPAGIALASLVFGALHLDPIHAGVAGVLGIYLGIVCHLAGSLRAAVVCHIANNVAALVFASYLPGAAFGSGWVAVAVGIATAAAALWWVRVRLDSSGTGSAGPSRDRRGATPSRAA